LENVHFREVYAIASNGIADEKRQSSAYLILGKNVIEDCVGCCSTISGDELNGAISVHEEEVLSHVLQVSLAGRVDVK
jgi:hypothetical protein